MAARGGTRTIRRIALVALALAAVLALTGCGTADDRDQAREVAERLYGAVQAGDGTGACSQLTAAARAELESQEPASCEDAILELDLEGTRAERVEVYVTEAAVHLDGGDVVFLDESARGWRVSAAGCRVDVPDAPAHCQLEA